MLTLKEYIPGHSINGPITEQIYAHISFDYIENLKRVSFVKHWVENKDFEKFVIDREKTPVGTYTLLAKLKTYCSVIGFLDKDIPEIEPLVRGE